MKIGIPKETKDGERRVSLTPEYCKKIVNDKNSVFVEYGAGLLSGFPDVMYRDAGASLVDQETVYGVSDFVAKVKEPLPEEYARLRKNLMLAGFFHFQGNPELERIFHKLRVEAIPYEDIQSSDGSYPILRAMSKIAGECAVEDVAKKYLKKENGGKGILLQDAVVTMLGFGDVGHAALNKLLESAARKVFIIDIKEVCLGNIGIPYRWLYSIPQNIECAVSESDVVIGGAFVHGKGAPILVTRNMVRKMSKKSLIIDIPRDEGGNFETSRPTSHSDPVFVDEGVLHYCVPNIPGGVPFQSTPALAREVWHYVVRRISQSPEYYMRYKFDY